jgi:2-polyprenyl-6-methoxyphenol hydroxylase-like FAD-dependent oxidoreductase
MATDVAIVGGGIAGSALATVLAREGLEVVVLERQLRYADRVRGENLHPWGVREAHHLGIHDILLAAGGHLVEAYVDYGDGDDPEAAEVAQLPLSHLFDDVPGELNLAHPLACEALAAAATDAGAKVLRGVRHVEVGAGRARVYLCPGTEDPQRYTGRGGLGRFLTASCFDAVPDGKRWAEATPAGPCRTFTADDTWTDRPLAEGVVLIGDAGGYNNPLIGQGLALALRDVRTLCEELLSSRSWDVGAFLAYGTERAERLRRMRCVAQLHATVATTFGPEGRRLRRDLDKRQQDDPDLLTPTRAILTGPDHLDPRICTEAFRRHYLGLAG